MLAKGADGKCITQEMRENISQNYLGTDSLLITLKSGKVNVGVVVNSDKESTVFFHKNL